jgi:ribonuclease-3
MSIFPAFNLPRSYSGCYTQSKGLKVLIDWQALQETIGINFEDEALLQQAFIHSSYVNENPDSPTDDNERLEFLRDALLSFIVAEKLYHEFAKVGEGDLTEMRVSLVRQETLAECAARLKLGNYLFLGKGEEATGGREKQTNLADAFEALIGAIYLEHGLKVVRDFILAQFAGHLKTVKLKGIERNYKAQLQELSQAKYNQLPAYHIVEASGPDHDKSFIIEVRLGYKILGIGSGKNKRAAEMEAARSALEKLATN